MVLKFGGTSLADSDRLRAAAARAAALAETGAQVVVVVSARGHTTDALDRDVREISPGGASAREADQCLSAGEQVSAGLMAMALHTLGREAVSLTGIQAGILTDRCHGNARILGLCSDRIQRELEKGRIVVVAGFQGVTADGEITTLGRGGSDTTAVALAAFLGARLCRIYTDVDGVYDRDPRIFPDAKRFTRIDYESMLALVENGAQVLHDRSVELARDFGIEVEVLSALTGAPGTVVGSF
jgi:aspartate kinase